ncbi:MAG: GNAT family N-acetyltransferase [Steroidobacteraceae bacterium]
MTNARPVLEFTPVHGEQIAAVVRLAQQIWPEHYRSIIGQAQVDYMLARFQSKAAITEQLNEGYEYFLLNWQGRQVGYAAVHAEPAERRLFVSKLYLLQSMRGRGLGRASMNYLARLAAQRGLPKLWLTVNKYNPALQAYLRMGFVNVGAVVNDIGQGYVMDDYRMEWTPASDVLK